MFPGFMLGGLGLLLLVIGIFMALRLRRFLRTAVAGQGNVVGFETTTHTDSDGDTSTSTQAVVEFAAAGGRTVKFVEKSQTFGGLSEGDPVPVKYDPADPEQARIATEGRMWTGTIVTGGLGLVLLVIGVIILVVAG